MTRSVASPFVWGKCTSGGSQYSQNGLKDTANGRAGCLGYTTTS